MRGLVLTL